MNPSKSKTTKPKDDGKTYYDMVTVKMPVPTATKPKKPKVGDALLKLLLGKPKKKVKHRCRFDRCDTRLCQDSLTPCWDYLCDVIEYCRCGRRKGSR